MKTINLTKNKAILTLTAVAVLTTGAFGCSQFKKEKMDAKHFSKKCDSFNKHTHHKKSPIIGLVMKLDLSKDQRAQIRTILKDLRKSIKHPTEAFTKSSFDKEVFITILKQKNKNKIKKEADAIEKIYKLLDETQKENLKTMLDMAKIETKR